MASEQVAIANLVLKTRHDLAAGPLGAVGAPAIRRALLARGHLTVPSIRTIYRIVARCFGVSPSGATGCHARRRHAPPPPGWYLPDLAAHDSELDSFDIVEALILAQGQHVEILNGISLHGGLVTTKVVTASVTARLTVASLIAHWRAFGLPTYAQFDNDPVFQGTHRSPVALGRVVRLCLSLGVTPVFAPPGEMGYQSMVESCNRWWRAKVWNRFISGSFSQLQARSRRYVAALREHRATRIAAAPVRRPFPQVWQLDLGAAPRGRIIYLRRTNANGALSLFGECWRIPNAPIGQLLRVELDLTRKRIRFFALHRSRVRHQPLLLVSRFSLPTRPFQGNRRRPKPTR